jgi:hypothetical protein
MSDVGYGLAILKGGRLRKILIENFGLDSKIREF